MVQVWSMDKSRVVVLGVAQHLINFSTIVEKKQFIRLAFSVSFTARLLSSRFNTAGNELAI